MSLYGNYNEFFNENICHVCKNYSDNMITCDKCRIITYCGQEHREIHSPQHMQICEAVQKFIKNEPHSDIRFSRQEDWIQLRKEYINLIKRELSRELQSYEIQMIMVGKSCFVCHQQADLKPCRNCYSAIYCKYHKDEFETLHNSSCEKLKLCLFTCKYAANTEIRLLKFSSYPDINRNDINMNTFINLYVKLNHSPNTTCSGWFANHYLYSEYVSNPLTLLNGILETNLLGTLNTECLRELYIIHIIGSVDERRLSYWEIFLHCLPYSTHLKIIVIGMELDNNCYDIKLCSDICRKAKRNGNRLTVNIYSMLYHDYVSSEEYMQPNIIIGLHTDFRDGDTWAETILSLRTQNCPLLLTSESSDKIEANKNKLQEVLGTPLDILHRGENKYHSLKPCRNYETGDVFYHNKYLILFPNLRRPSFS